MIPCAATPAAPSTSTWCALLLSRHGRTASNRVYDFLRRNSYCPFHVNLVRCPPLLAWVHSQQQSV